EGGVLLIPALADIGATGLFADRMQAVFADDGAGREIPLRDRRLDANPVGFALHGAVRPVRLFGVAGPPRGMVEHDGHLTRYLRTLSACRNWLSRSAHLARNQAISAKLRP